MSLGEKSAGIIRKFVSFSEIFIAYNDKTFKIMSETGYPVCYDASHSIQMPTSMGDISGGQREFIPSLTRAAVSAGVNALFIEVHNDPPNALSDANTVLDLQHLETVLIHAKVCHETRLRLQADWDDSDVHR